MCNTVRHFSICAVHVSDQRHQRNMTMRLLPTHIKLLVDVHAFVATEGSDNVLAAVLHSLQDWSALLVLYAATCQPQ
jgi:hypothetical protein